MGAMFFFSLIFFCKNIETRQRLSNFVKINSGRRRGYFLVKKQVLALRRRLLLAFNPINW